MRDETIHDMMRRILEDERQEAVEEAREGIMQEAVEERNMKIANDMIKKGFPTDQIAEIIKLDLNAVEQLRFGK